jgi:hypothetical protein
MRLRVIGALAVAMTVLVKDKAVKCKSVELSDLVQAIYLQFGKSKEGEYLTLHELAAKTQLIDDKVISILLLTKCCEIPLLRTLKNWKS